MKAIVWHSEDLGATFEFKDIPAEYQDQAKEALNTVPKTEKKRKEEKGTR